MYSALPPLELHSNLTCLAQFSIGWWLWIDGVAWKGANNDSISITFGHWMPGIVGTVGLFMYVSLLSLYCLQHCQ